MDDPQELERVRRYQEIVVKFLYGMGYVRGRVLDVGASEGWMCQYIPTNYAEYQGIDIEPVDPGSTVVRKGTIFSVNGQWDLIIYNHVFEHISDPVRELEAIHYRLKPNGRLFIAVPLAGTPWASWEHHFFAYHSKGMETLLKFTDFEIDLQFTICFREDKIELWTIAKKL